MKLSTETIDILNNFSTINPSIILRPGSVIRLGSPNLEVFAQATVKEAFDKQVGIYNLKKFLGVLSLFEGEPEIELNDTFIRITNGRQSMDYVIGEINLIKASPDKEPNVPAPDAEFDIKWSDLSTALKAVAVLDVPNISISGDGVKITLAALDPKNSSKDKYRVVIGETDKTFSTKLLKGAFKMLPRDYHVSAASAYAKFSSDDVTYWLPAAAE
jgi:hypothetical protein